MLLKPFVLGFVDGRKIVHLFLALLKFGSLYLNFLVLFGIIVLLWLFNVFFLLAPRSFLLLALPGFVLFFFLASLEFCEVVCNHKVSDTLRLKGNHSRDWVLWRLQQRALVGWTDWLVGAPKSLSD